MKKYEKHCKNFLSEVFYVESHKKDANIVELITNLKLRGLKKINLISKGDDYQILFTANINKARIIKNTSKTTGIKITKIGKIISGKDR